MTTPLKSKGKGKTAKPKNIIEDVLMEPYYINIEGNKAYVIYKKGENKPYGYYTSIGGCLNKIAGMIVDSIEKSRTIKEYFTEYNSLLNNFLETVKV